MPGRNTLRIVADLQQFPDLVDVALISHAGYGVFLITLDIYLMEAVRSLDWQKLEDMPVGKWEPASLVMDGKLVVLGGL